MKQCSKCKERKSFSEFNKDRSTKDGLKYYCRECGKKYEQIHRIEILERQRKYYQTHKIKIAKRHKKYNQAHKAERIEWSKKYYQKTGNKYVDREQYLKSRYGLTLEDYDQMIEDQDGVCAICGRINNDGRRLYVDHNHKTGKIRALLCHHCNSKLGVLEDEVFFNNAKKYLQKYKT